MGKSGGLRSRTIRKMDSNWKTIARRGKKKGRGGNVGEKEKKNPTIKLEGLHQPSKQRGAPM